MKKGSKSSGLLEIPEGSREPTGDQVLAEYIRLEDIQDRVLGSLIRRIKAYELQPGDEIPEDVALRRATLVETRAKMKILSDDFPWLLSGSDKG